MSKRLSKKEKGFIKDIVKGKTGTQAALNNYDTESENVAGAIASENLRKPKIQQAIQSIADRIPDEDLLKVHKEGLKATSGIGDNTQVDYGVRHKYLDTAYKLKGSFAPEKNVNLNLNLDDGLTEEEKDTIRKLFKR